MSGLDKIKQYGRRLEKHPDDKAVLKETLHKLDKMEVTMDVLQQTGIGKIVSCLKKRGDSVGSLAAELIHKWRKVVDQEAEMNGHHPDEPGSVDDTKNKKHSHEAKTTKQHSTAKSSSSSHHGSGRSKQSSSEVRPEPELFCEADPVKRISRVDPANRASSSSSIKDKHHESSERRKEESSRKSGNHREDGAKDGRRKAEADKHADQLVPVRSSDSKRDRDKGGSSSSSSHTKHGSGGNSEKKAKSSAEDSKSSKASSEKPVVKQEPKDKERKDRKRKASEGETPAEGQEVEGMNARNFGSFEDCLGSIDPKKAKKKKRLNGNKSSSSVASSPKMTVTSSTLNGSISKPKGPRLPDLVDSKKPSQLDPLPLPQLVTDYKPLPRLEPKPSTASTSGSGASAARRTMTNEEAVMFTSSRKDRTAVYSGRKQHSLSTVPTLYEACVRVLVDNVDMIDETGGVPFEIMRPIMERCTWQQLYRLEYYNPNLTEDSDPLWETHVRRDFRGKTPAKGEETWRELYLRCHDEREQKLKDLKESIGQSMKAKQAPVRMTKLAYVDTLAKPPRNVQRAQIKHGSQSSSVSRPSQARSIASHASTSAAAEAVRAPSTAAARKPKPAPLMAKTLMFLKMRKSTGYGFASR